MFQVSKQNYFEHKGDSVAKGHLSLANNYFPTNFHLVTWTPPFNNKHLRGAWVVTRPPARLSVQGRQPGVNGPTSTPRTEREGRRRIAATVRCTTTTREEATRFIFPPCIYPPKNQNLCTNSQHDQLKKTDLIPNLHIRWSILARAA